MPVPGGETMCDGAACEEPVAAWDVATVCAWAQENKIPEFAVLARSEDIDGPVLLTIEHSDLRAEPLAAALKEAGVNKFGQMRRLELALEKIRNRRGGWHREAAQTHTPSAECHVPNGSMPYQHAISGVPASPAHHAASAAPHRRAPCADMEPRLHDVPREYRRSLSSRSLSGDFVPVSFCLFCLSP